ncbi:translesion DNA synthesis-associated protein ImuA [Vibrio sp. Vb2880]|uniref:translesion DNA synthesis-associated protein ImuA n=1 Tax=Vibrio sp. Vb2880 TaxID=2816076 RepID=UPI001A8E6DD2|nr:translesion DNA synthesis-associated protein ImuA [Vibrio sp. Vb2880]MBO0212449.1 translesion DNA synthesis-associated protein ImuA [Vibrio sp. Vb2880]
MYELIEHLKNKHWLWQGSDTPCEPPSHATGFAELDSQLAGGFPAHGVIDIQSACGIGELRLLFPYLQQHHERLTVLINPPGQVHAESLQHAGIHLDNVLILTPQTTKEALWSAEQCARSGACSQVLLWQDKLEVHHARRLQVACETGDCLQFLFRSRQDSLFSLPVTMTLVLNAHPQGVEVRVPKRRGGWPLGAFSVSMAERWQALTLPRPTSVVVPFPLRKQG